MCDDDGLGMLGVCAIGGVFLVFALPLASILLSIIGWSVKFIIYEFLSLPVYFWIMPLIYAAIAINDAFKELKLRKVGADDK